MQTLSLALFSQANSTWQLSASWFNTKLCHHNIGLHVGTLSSIAAHFRRLRKWLNQSPIDNIYSLVVSPIWRHIADICRSLEHSTIHLSFYRLNQTVLLLVNNQVSLNVKCKKPQASRRSKRACLFEKNQNSCKSMNGLFMDCTVHTDAIRIIFTYLNVWESKWDLFSSKFSSETKNQEHFEMEHRHQRIFHSIFHFKMFSISGFTSKCCQEKVSLSFLDIYLQNKAHLFSNRNRNTILFRAHYALCTAQVKEKRETIDTV